MRLYARAECARTLREKDQRTCWDSAFGVEESQHVVVSELDTSKYLTQFFDGHRVQFFEIGHVRDWTRGGFELSSIVITS